MKTVHIIIAIATSFILLQSCGESKAPAKEAVLDLPVTNHMVIYGAGRGDGGKALWVKCAGHNQTAYVAVNGIACKSVYTKEVMTCVLPSEYVQNKNADLVVEIVNENQGRKSPSFTLTAEMQKPQTPQIKIISHGYGDDDKGVWITCENHTNETKVYYAGAELKTFYYEKHVTATLPENALTKPHVVYLKDNKTGAVSPEFTIGQVK